VSKTGRKSEYKTTFNRQVYLLTLLGATDKEIAKFFDVSEPTINTWKKKYPKFLVSLKKGKDEADLKVAASLFKRATGFTLPDTYIDHFKGVIVEKKIKKHYPPDVTAIIFWLKNRQRDKWTDTKVNEHRGKLSITDLVKDDE
jgi:hypothetical protein